jgi:hypothetical protein
MIRSETRVAVAVAMAWGLSACADGVVEAPLESTADAAVSSQEEELLRFGSTGSGAACQGGRGGFFADLMCNVGLDMNVPFGGAVETIGVVFEVPGDRVGRHDELARPLCPPGRRLAALRTHRMHDTPLEGTTAHETWIDLRSSQYGVEGWRNQGMFIPEEVRWFYEPTADLGGWKKQYVSETQFEQTSSGWTATNYVDGQLFTRLEFRRSAVGADVPAHLRAYLDQPLDMVGHPEPHYILKPADFDPALYDSVDPVVYDSRWTPLGPVEESVEVGTVRITWARPSGTSFDLRWMDLLPPSGTELPGYYFRKSPEPGTTEQRFTHDSRGYGECAPWR